MPRTYTKITPQIVKKVKGYLEDDRGFSKKEISRLVGISDHSVAKIAQGLYDPPVEKPEAMQSEDSSMSHQGFPVNYTEIPYERLEYLMKCEMFINEMFESAIASDKDDAELYFPRHNLNNMCSRYFPNDFSKHLRRVHTDDTWNTYA